MEVLLLDPEIEQQVTGLRWHKPSRQYIAKIGYHQVLESQPNSESKLHRVQTAFYLGAEKNAAVERYFQIRKDWIASKTEQRREHDKEQASRKLENLPPLPRFKPVWPKIVKREISTQEAVSTPPPQIPPQMAAYPVPAFVAQQEKERAELLKMTIKEAYDRYLPMQKARIGLHGGKGINANSYRRHSQNLTLGLALNVTYSRETKPIDVNKRLGELTERDYESFVQFWCNPAHAKSERTTINYTGAFSRMLRRLKVPLPDRFDEIFRMKITQPTKIVRYNPDLLKRFLQHPNERTRLACLMCLNLGYYQVDISRLKLEHITDASGNPYEGGEMFITKRRERTKHQNSFTTTIYVWPETQHLMEKYRAPLQNLGGYYFLTKEGVPYKERGIGWSYFDAARKMGLPYVQTKSPAVRLSNRCGAFRSFDPCFRSCLLLMFILVIA